jgi:hypothetical protein
MTLTTMRATAGHSMVACSRDCASSMHRIAVPETHIHAHTRTHTHTSSPKIKASIDDGPLPSYGRRRVQLQFVGTNLRVECRWVRPRSTRRLLNTSESHCDVVRLIGTVVDDDACSMRDAISTEQSNQRII